MKMRMLKLTPKFLVELLQGKVSSFNSNLPVDLELLDLKYDLFSRQVYVILRSDSFEDVAETFPIPEFNLTIKDKSKNEPLQILHAKTELKQLAKPQVLPGKVSSKIENEFSPEQRKLLSFTVKENYMVVKPTQFLKAEWEDINEVVKSLGGKWVKGDIISYWEVPL